MRCDDGGRRRRIPPPTENSAPSGPYNKKRKAGLLKNPGAGMTDIDTLYAAAMLRQPGFDAVISSLADYRAWMATSGAVHPKEAYTQKGIDSWLKALA